MKIFYIILGFLNISLTCSMSVVISVLDDDLFNDVSYTKNPDEDLNTVSLGSWYGLYFYQLRY